jgi:1-acyl-sn-glycerol-3-phosphate acyltransferase
MGFLRASVRMAAFAATGITLVIGANVIDALAALTPGKKRDIRLVARRRKDAFLRGVLQALCAACGIRVHADIATLQLVSSGARTPTLVLANHVSYLDVVVLGSLFPCGFLAKREVADWPIVGWSGRALGMEFVERECLGSRTRMLRRLRSRLRTDTLCVFPEGSTTCGTTPDESLWQRGQLWSVSLNQARVVGFGLHYADQSALAWTGDMAFAPHLWAVLKRRHTDVFVCGEALPVHPVSPSRVYPAEAMRPVDARACAKTVFEHISSLCRKAHVLSLQFQNRKAIRAPLSKSLTEEVSPCKLSP